jgi:hypothetical protein
MNKLQKHYKNLTQRSLSLLLLIGIILLSLSLKPKLSVQENEQHDNTAAQSQYKNLPLAFEPNRGQAKQDSEYLVHHGQATTYFNGAKTTTTIGGSDISMSLEDSSNPNFSGVDQLESKTNYFIGQDQSRWHRDIPNYKQLIAKNVYPGIDLKYYGTNSQLEHDFIVSPGADYKQIAFHFDGQKNLILDTEGNLILKTEKSDLRLNAPITYQQTSSSTGKSKHTIPSKFELNDNKVTIALDADYDRTQTLIIDPTLVYSTYLGGTDNDNAYNIAVDSTGNAYVSGQSDSTSNFPVVSPFQAANAGGSDTFVAKFNSTGSALVYSTYLGGSGVDWGDGGIAVDASGNVYVSGNTDSSDFPTSSPYQATYGGGGLDAFITKLDPTGSSLVYSTYLGGSGADWAIGGLAIDTGDNVYVSGKTNSIDFPTASPFQGSNTGGYDAYVAKLDSTGTTLVYSSYLGGSGNEVARDLGIDSSNNIYVTGFTDSLDYPTSSPYQGSNAGGTNDAFLSKVDASGSFLTYSTYLGGTGNEEVYGIAVDGSGSAYIVGSTDSADLPVASPYQGAPTGFGDAFITKFDNTGTALTYSTYLGGGSGDFARGVDVDQSGNAYIIGITSSSDFPLLAPVQSTLAGWYDIFVTKLNSSGSALVYSTYLGGTSLDDTYGDIVADSSGNAYISGYTRSTDFPTFDSFQASHGGSTNDAFIAKFNPELSLVVSGYIDPTLNFTLSSNICDLGVFSTTQTKSCTHTITAATNAANGYILSYIPTTTLTSGANTITDMATQSASVLASEQFGFNLKANTSAGSFTAANFGADPIGGSGSVMTGYELADQFKFSTSGDNIAQSTTTTDDTVYTASFIANVQYVTQAGTYSTPITYNIVASY